LKNKEINEEVLTSKMVEHLDTTKMSKERKAFCMYFVESNNASQSYRKAFSSKTSKINCAKRGYDLLHKPEVQAEIRNLKGIMSVGVDITPTQYISFLLKVIGADMGEFSKFGNTQEPMMSMLGPIKDEDGKIMMKDKNYVKLMESDDLDTSLISKIKQGRDGVTIELQDKKWAWEKLREYFHWGEDDRDDNDSGTNTFLEALEGKVDNTWGGEGDDSNRFTNKEKDE